MTQIKQQICQTSRINFNEFVWKIRAQWVKLFVPVSLFTHPEFEFRYRSSKRLVQKRKFTNRFITILSSYLLKNYELIKNSLRTNWKKFQKQTLRILIFMHIILNYNSTSLIIFLKMAKVSVSSLWIYFWGRISWRFYSKVAYSWWWSDFNHNASWQPSHRLLLIHGSTLTR